MHIWIQEPKRVVFMGTPDFAVPSLRALLEHAPPGRLWASGLDVVGVVTRPDKPAGRGRAVAASPVKQYALATKLPAYQPGSLRRPEAQALLRSLRPDIIIVVAFGQILPPEVLDYPPHGCLNVHASLLPRWRGASPIAAAILAGDTDTGVTIMEMGEGLDTGPVVAQRFTPIDPAENAGELSERLARVGADLLIDTLPLWLADGIDSKPQNDAEATMTRPLNKEDGRLDWSLSADELARRVRAFTPWPGAYTTWNGKILKVQKAYATTTKEKRAPGTCFVMRERRARMLTVACGTGVLALEVVQLQGKRAMSADELVRGHPALANALLGSAPKE